MSIKKITPTEQKHINYKNIYSYIYQKRNTSKQAMAVDLGLSLPTITQNLKELEECGLVTKDGLFESNGGRKAYIFRSVSTAKISIGVEVLKEIVNIVAVNLYGEILDTETLDVTYENSRLYYCMLGNWVNNFIARLPFESDKILGVGIAVQGLTSIDGTSIIYGKIMKNAGVTLENFAQYIQYPCILMHDAEAAAFAELWFHKELDDAIYIGLNRNVGGAVIVDGRIHRGLAGRSGAIEHMRVVSDGRPCHCGRKGCMEAYCSGDRLKTDSGMTIDAFFEALHAGDARCREIWEDYLRCLAFSIDNIRCVLDSTIILGGLIAAHLTEDDFHHIRDFIPGDWGELHLVSGSCGAHSTIVGAALYYIDLYLKSI